jgi:alkylated DNA repair dioxygenase AlkB
VRAAVIGVTLVLMPQLTFGAAFEPARPPGFLLVPAVISPDEERALLSWLASSPGWNDVIFRGQKAMRRALAFGARYLAQGKQLVPAPPLPPELTGYRDRMVEAACAGLGRALVLGDKAPADFALCTALHYPPGAPIGWHADNRAFGPTVMSLSLGAPAQLQLRRAVAPSMPVEFTLWPRSLFVLAGEARAAWHHRIRPVEAERYSFTVRTPAAPEGP